MKHLKQKLMAAAAMLAVSAVMLTSASYAWFTISVTPEVKTVTTTITSNENFEIAWGTTKDTTPLETTLNDTNKDNTWGATITSIPLQDGLGPATVDSKKLVSAKYGVDGRPDGYAATTETDFAGGMADVKDAQGNIIGQKILVWLRSNMGGTVSVDVTGVDFQDKDGTSINGANKNKVNVAFDYGLTGNIVEADVKAVADKDLAEGKVETLGTIEANKPVQVAIYIYLEGENVFNADVSVNTNKAVVGSIKFSHSAVQAADAYAHSTLNPKTN